MQLSNEVCNIILRLGLRPMTELSQATLEKNKNNKKYKTKKYSNFQLKVPTP